MEGKGSAKNAAVVLLLVAFIAAANSVSSAATRAEVIDAIVSSLALPAWGGEKRFSDIGPGHPYGPSVETASALGILDPAERFYPDMEATRAEAVMFALQSMGLRHEAAITNSLEPASWPNLPVFISPYMTLASQIQPLPLGSSCWNRGSVSRQDLLSLGSWLRSAPLGCLGERSSKEDSVLVLGATTLEDPIVLGVPIGRVRGTRRGRKAAGTLRKTGMTATGASSVDLGREDRALPALHGSLGDHDEDTYA